MFGEFGQLVGGLRDLFGARHFKDTHPVEHQRDDENQCQNHKACANPEQRPEF